MLQQAKNYLSKNADAAQQVQQYHPKDAEAKVAEHLTLAKRYFDHHAKEDVFYTTNNGQVFLTIDNALNHAKNLPNDPVVLKVERADVADLPGETEEETANKGKGKGKAKGTPTE